MVVHARLHGTRRESRRKLRCSKNISFTWTGTQRGEGEREERRGEGGMRGEVRGEGMREQGARKGEETGDGTG